MPSRDAIRSRNWRGTFGAATSVLGRPKMNWRHDTTKYNPTAKTYNFTTRRTVFLSLTCDRTIPRYLRGDVVIPVSFNRYGLKVQLLASPTSCSLQFLLVSPFTLVIQAVALARAEASLTDQL